MFLETGNVINYVGDVFIKMTDNGKGRGVFASKDMAKGDLIIVERAIF